MRKQLFFVLIFTSIFGSIKAQTFRPGVLVIGNGNTAFAAAMQSAVSGVKTTILLQAGGFDISPLNEEINSGIQADFLKRYREFLQAKDSTQPIVIDKQKANNLLSIWTDSIKNLTIIRNIMWVKAERAGNNWSFKLSDGSTIRPKVFINPGDTKINDALKISVATASKWTKLDYSSTDYRTSVAAGKSSMGTTGTIFSMYNLFIPFQENLIWLNDSESMLLGQAGGATAAYAAFFDTKTSLSNLRKIQGELIHYKLNLLPFADIAHTDTTWRAIQQVAITGVLKADIDGKTAKFSPDKLVTTDEIRQPIKDYFYKAQIWFDDYKNPIMTIGSTLDMISYVGNKSLETIKKDIEKNWKTSYQFNTTFDLNRQINRKELAVLLQDYMPPFNVNIDEKGKVIR
jgi:hypothetical protein